MKENLIKWVAERSNFKIIFISTSCWCLILISVDVFIPSHLVGGERRVVHKNKTIRSLTRGNSPNIRKWQKMCGTVIWTDLTSLQLFDFYKMDRPCLPLAPEQWSSEKEEGGREDCWGNDDVLQNIVTSGDLIKIVLFFSNLFIVFHKAVTEITRGNISSMREIFSMNVRSRKIRIYL